MIDIGALATELGNHLKRRRGLDDNTISNLSASEYAKYFEEQLAVPVTELPVIANGHVILTVQQQQTIVDHAPRDEHELIVYLTPYLVPLCTEAGLNFVNSEEKKWIHTLLEHSDNYLKPDGISSMNEIYEKTAESRANLRELRVAQVPNTEFLFGGGIWKIRDFYILWEFKTRIGRQDRGVAYNYVCHVSRGDAWNKYFVILCDISQFCIVEGAEGAVTSVKRGLWTALGAQEALLEVLRQRNHSFRLLEGLSRSLNVTPLSFLGSGQFGRCFLVRDQQGVNMVLKTVLTIWNDDGSIEVLLRGEYRRLTEILVGKQHVVDVVAGSLTEVRFGDSLLGLGYLMRTVGEPLDPTKCRGANILRVGQLLQSLNVLHLSGIFHGDARVYNALLVGGQIVWIDFVYGDSEEVGHDGNRRKKKDMEALIKSLYGPEKLLEGALPGLLQQYGIDLNVQQFGAYLAH